MAKAGKAKRPVAQPRKRKSGQHRHATAKAAAPTAGRVHVIGPGEIRFEAAGGVVVDPRGRATHFIGDPHPKRWQGDRIEIALRALYFGDIPARAQLPNSDLVLAVQNYMRDHDMVDAKRTRCLLRIRSCAPLAASRARANRFAGKQSAGNLSCWQSKRFVTLEFSAAPFPHVDAPLRRLVRRIKVPAPPTHRFQLSPERELDRILPLEQAARLCSLSADTIKRRHGDRLGATFPPASRWRPIRDALMLSKT